MATFFYFYYTLEKIIQLGDFVFFVMNLRGFGESFSLICSYFLH